MQEATPRVRGARFALLSSAPLVRITAGIGLPTQKTWNLRHPVTLIGARRPSSIVLHDREVSKAHCVIVNTGSDVLLKDLHTPAGTMRGKERIDLAVLEDGDVVTIGTTAIQIAIQIPQNRSGDSGCDLECVDPNRLPKPVSLKLEHTERCWRIEDAVTLLGRHDLAAVRVDHEAVSSRQAIVFRFGASVAIFDLVGRGGLRINGHVCGSAVLAHGDRVSLGPLALVLEAPEWSTKVQGNKAGQSSMQRLVLAESEREARARAGKAFSAKPPALPTPGRANQRIENRDPDSSQDLVKIARELAALQQHIGTSWDRLNSWEAKEAATSVSSEKKLNLATKEAALDAKDAMLRGQMHEISRYHEQLAARERELAAQLAKLQAQRDELASIERAHSKRTTEMDQRWEELKRREHVLAQRWARLSTVTCPNCGEPINTGAGGAIE